MSEAGKILVNRAPVLTLWGAVVAERLGFAWEEALTFGKALAGKQAQAKGRMLGIYHVKPGSEAAPKHGLGEEFWLDLCGRPIPARRTAQGVRAVVGAEPIDPPSVERYLRQKGMATKKRARRCASWRTAGILPRSRSSASRSTSASAPRSREERRAGARRGRSTSSASASSARDGAAASPSWTARECARSRPAPSRRRSRVARGRWRSSGRSRRSPPLV